MSVKIPRRGLVVIFKAPGESEKEENDPYKEALSNGGFDVINIPVLDFEFFNLERLFDKLNKPEDYSGIIFSSPRCVRGCQLAGDVFGLTYKWKCHRNFAVGEATARTAEEIGFLVSGKETGNANDLADVITKCAYGKPFLYPIGSLTNSNFKAKLKEHGVEIDDIVIYKTKPHPDLKVNLQNLSDKLIQPVYFLYFSPSGVNFTLPTLRENHVNLEDVKFVAIGPTTEKGLKEHGLNVYRTVSKPNPTSALEALTS